MLQPVQSSQGKMDSRFRGNDEIREDDLCKDLRHVRLPPTSPGLSLAKDRRSESAHGDDDLARRFPGEQRPQRVGRLRQREGMADMRLSRPAVYQPSSSSKESCITCGFS